MRCARSTRWRATRPAVTILDVACNLGESAAANSRRVAQPSNGRSLGRVLARFGVAGGVLALLLLPIATTIAGAQIAAGKLKLPAERTSPTGNFFTLEAYNAPGGFDMKVCTSAHTPADTAIDPNLFSVLLTNRVVIAPLSPSGAGALRLQPLAPRQCTEGWLAFHIPRGAKVSKLEYDYNGTISWAVG